ncbi:TIGR03503 family protein [Shewanella gelidimarina]|uniref:TIGR03503 family protein n=1 Tax=Shewanella gelidimarina TaxID=56813 RepID=UPI00200F3FDE|nr:TIGR03503 family protein [Shewanella gelidimarina]MCL1058722.1 TIGR03503 family protein [Shewanella gelidimarina]
MIKRVTACVVMAYLGLMITHCAVAEVMLSSQASELKNRFRIDHMVDSVTLLIHREYGSSPVIIVQPDGSKWYISRHPEHVKWMDGLTGDMITIKNPMPGPWQLIGKVVEGSVIDKVSVLSIDVDPIPQPLYQGERLKLTARLIGDEQKVRLPGLDYLMSWTAKFISDNNPADENFAAGSVIVGTYRDNGESLDERPDDGVFTSKLNLTQAWGSYTLQVMAKNAVLERKYSEPFRLSTRPIAVDIVAPQNLDSGEWDLRINVDENELVLAETHVEAEIVGPAGMRLQVTVAEINSPETLYSLRKVNDFGSYRIKLTAVSTTQNGREIYLTLPELFFNFIKPPEPPPSAEALAAKADIQAKKAENTAKEDAVFWLITVNTVLLILGILVLLFVRKRSNLKKALAATQARMDKESQQQKMTLALDEIDLSMPEDFDDPKAG